PPLGRSWTALRQGARSRPRARSGRAERPQQGHARSLSLGDSGTRGRMLVASAAPEQEGQMLFHVVWDFVDTSEEGIRRSLTLFGQWQPPAGAEFQGFYGFADGTGGVAIIEAVSVATLARTTAPWTPWLRFTATPIHPIEESSAIAGEAMA